MQCNNLIELLSIQKMNIKEKLTKQLLINSATTIIDFTSLYFEDADAVPMYLILSARIMFTLKMFIRYIKM